MTFTRTTILAAAAAVLMTGAAAPAQAAERAGTAPGAERALLAGAGTERKVRLTAKDRRALRKIQKSLARQNNRAYGEYLGPYCMLWQTSSSTDYTCQWQETFGLWRTWTHTWRKVPHGWQSLGWNVY